MSLRTCCPISRPSSASPSPGETSVEDVEDAGFAALGMLASRSPVRIDGAWATVAEWPDSGSRSSRHRRRANDT